MKFEHLGRFFASCKIFKKKTVCDSCIRERRYIRTRPVHLQITRGRVYLLLVYPLPDCSSHLTSNAVDNDEVSRAAVNMTTTMYKPEVVSWMTLITAGSRGTPWRHGVSRQQTDAHVAGRPPSMHVGRQVLFGGAWCVSVRASMDRQTDVPQPASCWLPLAITYRTHNHACIAYNLHSQ